LYLGINQRSQRTSWLSKTTRIFYTPQNSAPVGWIVTKGVKKARISIMSTKYHAIVMSHCRPKAAVMPIAVYR
jgi:hypothetical protein